MITRNDMIFIIAVVALVVTAQRGDVVGGAFALAGILFACYHAR